MVKLVYSYNQFHGTIAGKFHNLYIVKWTQCNYADTQCYKHSNNKLALVRFILKVNLCENHQKQQKEGPSYFDLI